MLDEAFDFLSKSRQRLVPNEHVEERQDIVPRIRWDIYTGDFHGIISGKDTTTSSVGISLASDSLVLALWDWYLLPKTPPTFEGHLSMDDAHALQTQAISS